MHGGDGDRARWCWVTASAGQLGWGIWSYRRGFNGGDSRLMPLRAFGVASLFVGAAASASFAGIKFAGINKVEDLVALGANIRTGIGAPPPRTRDD